MLTSVKFFSTADEWTEGGTWKSAQRFVLKGIVGGISVDGQGEGMEERRSRDAGLLVWSGVEQGSLEQVRGPGT